MKTLIIAEAGVNHNGDIKIAKQLIKKAADAGADYIKFQTFITEENITISSPRADYQIKNTQNNESQFEMVKKLELSEKDHLVLLNECKKRGIKFFSTAFDLPSLKLILKFNPEYIKIPSGEITNLPFIREIAKYKKKIILSTGMSNMEEIRDALNVLENGSATEILILHCTTEYPAPISEVNLKAMKSIQKEFDKRVGYSDHTLGIEVPIAAVAMGASVIEKHFTLDRGMKGPDHAASLEPKELKIMIDSIRNIEKAMGNGIKSATSSEIKNKLIARKSITAKEKIKRGMKYSSKNITVKRPGSGISPMLWDEVIGKIAKRDYEIDDLIEL
tara:strand:+ start:761 stop:1756 length:996 start_codon:yes stop_codon:yes gene_type:complete